MNEPRFIAHFAQAIHALRPDWHTAGITAALRASDQPATAAAAMLHRAANPANRTPQLQPADYADTPAVRCPAGSGAWPHGRCAGCHNGEPPLPIEQVLTRHPDWWPRSFTVERQPQPPQHHAERSS